MPAPRLYLITPPLTDAAAFAAPFAAALDAGDVACVLVRATESAVIGRLAPIAQRRGIACLVRDPRRAVESDCDGVHVDGVSATLEAALAAMKPQRIVGVGGLASCHDAMSAAEADVDYVMFGAPDEPRDFAEIRERIAWWAEIFNPPCVGYAQALDEVAALAGAGADFVAVCDVVWSDPRGPAAGVEAVERALTAAREPTA
ncbi:MAG: thiamine phosphate synthase [Methylovirgula sp.]